MNEQEAPEATADAEAAMDQAAARLRSQMSKTIAALQPRLTTLANLATAALTPRAAEPPLLGAQVTRAA